MELVDVDKPRLALLFRDRGPADRRLRDHGDEEPAEDRGTFRLEEGLCRVYEHDLAGVHRIKEIDLVFW